MKTYTKAKAIALTLLGVLLLTGSYALGANMIALPSSVTALVSNWFPQGSLITITTNVNSPKGSLIAGRSQVFGVYDVRTIVAGSASLKNVPLKVQLNDGNVSVSNIYINYNYCLPKGNIYAYGYKYGYAGLSCYGYSIPVNNVRRVGNEYQINASVNWPIYATASNAFITVGGTPYYTTNVKANAKLRVGFSDAAMNASGEQCKAVYYGYKNKYSYSKCTPLSLKVKIASAIGNWLTLSRPYGYGYINKTPIVVPTDTSRVVPHRPITTTSTSSLPVISLIRGKALEDNQIVSGESISIEGSNLVAAGKDTQVFVGDMKAPVTQYGSELVWFTAPKLITGKTYPLFVKTTNGKSNVVEVTVVK